MLISLMQTTACHANQRHSNPPVARFKIGDGFTSRLGEMFLGGQPIQPQEYTSHTHRYQQWPTANH